MTLPGDEGTTGGVKRGWGDICQILHTTHHVSRATCHAPRATRHALPMSSYSPVPRTACCLRSDRAQILLHRIDDMAKFNSTEGIVTPMIFSEFVKHNPGLLLPAFHLQLQIKQNVVNPKYWDKIQQRRADKYHDTFDGGWLTIQRELIKTQHDRKTKDPKLAAEKKVFKQGLSKEKRLVMEKRQVSSLVGGVVPCRFGG